MKKYNTLGELLIDYRKEYGISQADLAAQLNVDIRTVSRWEKDETLVKSDKEEELVEATFIPYQVIRNLNAWVAIPVYYDFKLRKYATSKISKSMPSASWFREQMDHQTDRIRPVQYDSDLEVILKYSRFGYGHAKDVDESLIRKAVALLPELNLILDDTSGYYCGHSVFFPLSHQAYEKLRRQEITESHLQLSDLVDYRKKEKPVFHAFSLTADCNENMYYIVGALLRFFRQIKGSDYLYTSLTARHDSYELNEQMGIKQVWEDKAFQQQMELPAPLRFYEGNFDEFLKRHEN